MDTERQSSQDVPPGPTDSTPGSWRVKPIESGVRVEIWPHRDWLHAFACLGGGALVAGFGLKLSGLLAPQEEGSRIIGFALFAVFAITALGFLRAAVFSLAEHRILELRPTGLRAESFAGPFRQVRQYERERIHWIEVEDGPLSILEELPWPGSRAALRLEENGNKATIHRLPLGLTRGEAWEIVALYRRHVEGREVQPTAQLKESEFLKPLKRLSETPNAATSLVGRIQLALAVWILALILTIIVTAIGIGFGHPFPRWLELPWNGVNDYVVSADGQIWVHVGFYGMLLSYDSDGRFLASRPGFTSGIVCLAAAADGRLFVRNANTVHILSPDGNKQHRVDDDREGSYVWRLAADGSMEYDPNPPIGAKAHDRPARPGEIAHRA